MKARQGEPRDRGNWLEEIRKKKKKKMKRQSVSQALIEKCHRAFALFSSALSRRRSEEGSLSALWGSREMMCSSSHTFPLYIRTWGGRVFPAGVPAKQEKERKKEREKKDTLMCIWILIYMYWVLSLCWISSSKDVLKVSYYYSFPFGLELKLTLQQTDRPGQHRHTLPCVSPLETEKKKKKKKDHIFFYDDCNSTLDECGK